MRYEFLGSYILVCIGFIFIVTIPLAIIHIINNTVRIDEQMGNPSEFLAQHKQKPSRWTLP